MPRISVILPVYNGTSHLNECLDSLLSQSFKDFEILLIDDFSTDNSRETCEEYQSRDKRIRFFQNPVNQGTASTTNLGHRLAQGEYIAHADQDDISKPQRLARQAVFLKKNPQICMVSGQMQAFGLENGSLEPPSRMLKSKATFYLQCITYSTLQ